MSLRIEVAQITDTSAPILNQDVITTTALIISKTPYSQSDDDNYFAAEQYHRTKVSLATSVNQNTPNSEQEYLQEIAATAEKLAKSTPNLPEVIHFLAARSIVDYQRSQIGFMPIAVTTLEVTP